MAAPILPASQQKASLNKLLVKESGPKVTHKNLLVLGPQEWPRPSQSVEDGILSKLTEKLKSAPNMFKPTKKCSPEDITEKTKVKSQLQIGASSVFRALEKDALACVLVSGQATPAMAVEHIISLGRERGCPLLCLDQLAPTVAKATASKCYPLCIGFKKVADSSMSYFTDVISLVMANCEIRSQPRGPSVTALPDTTSISTREGIKIKENKFRPLRIGLEAETEILEELKRAFSQIQVVGVDGSTKKRKKKKHRKRDLKSVFDKSYHLYFDTNKQSVTYSLERGKLGLILISEKISPILLAETQSCSLLSIAKEKKCPVLVIPGLGDTMKALCGGFTSVLGFKKLSSLQGDSLKIFSSLIEKCANAVAKLGETTSKESDGKETATQVSPVSNTEENVLSTVTSRDSSAQKGHGRSVESTMEAEEDYSYLYVLKTDSKAYAESMSNLTAETESTAKSATFSADFISLSSDSKEKNSSQPLTSSKGDLPVQPKKSSRTDLPSRSSESAAPSQLPACDNSTPVPVTIDTTPSISGVSEVGPSTVPLFSVCRSGTLGDKAPASFAQSRITTHKKTETSETDSNVLGMKDVLVSQDAKTEGIDFLSFSEPSKKPKKALKRKLDADSSFISFNYTEANIKTMTSNPSKKKKQKKKRNK